MSSALGGDHPTAHESAAATAMCTVDTFPGCTPWWDSQAPIPAGKGQGACGEPLTTPHDDHAQADEHGPPPQNVHAADAVYDSQITTPPQTSSEVGEYGAPLTLPTLNASIVTEHVSTSESSLTRQAENTAADGGAHAHYASSLTTPWHDVAIGADGVAMVSAPATDVSPTWHACMWIRLCVLGCWRG